MRIGTGYDVHRLVENRRLVLCGVEIPSELGLLGHSDADVAVHALMDAILGALALGDIGKLFPDSDPQYKGADSMKLLAEVVSRMEKSGFALGNLDITIIAERPQLAKYIPAMRQRLAEAFRCDISQVSVKATTEEGLVLAGGGIGAQAAVLLESVR
ncbi:MAG: 2-C-methyl-D-erythritol 2,4-cyclodiphosphate synthase [Oscillospiraceae bacterium]